MKVGRRATALLLPLALLLTAMPAQAHATMPTTKRTAKPVTERVHRVERGIFRILTRDVPGPGGVTHDEQRPVLELPNGKWIDLHLPKGTTPSYNAPVELRGVGSDTQLDVEAQQPLTMAEYSAGTVQRQALTSSTQSTTGTTSVLVILAYWTQPDAVTPTSAANVIFTQGNPWWKEASYGQLAITGKVTPWVHISAPTYDCYSDGDSIMSHARTAASAYNPGSYQRVIVYFPACGGSPGWAFVGAGSVWINGSMDLRVTIHEQGHNYGLGHAHSYGCTSGGRPTTLVGSCSASEYGDPFDAMGGGSYVGHFSGRHKDLLHWLGSGRKQDVTSGGFILTPLETPSGLKAVQIPTSGRSYWVEYRVATGKDKSLPPGATGVQVRLVDSRIGDGGPLLLDQRPGDGGYDDFESVSLPAGSSWVSPDGVRISVTSVTGTTAEVHVAGGATARAPAAPTALLANAGDASATVKWTKPADNGSIITSYVVTSSPGGKTATVSSVGGTTTATTVGGLLNGTAYTFSVVAKNAVGSSPASAPSAAVTPVAAVPTISLTSPKPAAVVTGDTVPLTVSVAASTISKAPVTSVEYRLDGNGVAYSSTAPFSAVLSLLYETTGPHTLTAIAYDANGRIGKTAPVAFSYAPPLPTVSIASPVDGTAVLSAALPVTLNAAPGSLSHPLNSVYATLEDGSYAGTAEPDAPPATTWSFTWDLSGLSEGTHVLTAHAIDDLQRVTHSTPVTVTVTFPAPLVQITSPLDGGTVLGSGNVSVHVAPNASGGGAVQSVQLVADDVTNLGTLYAGSPGTESDPWTLLVDWRTLGNGPHTLTAKATNESFYSTTTPALPIVVRNPTPGANVTAPTEGATPLGTVTLHATGIPDGSVIASLTFLLDGSYLGAGTDGAGDWTYDWDTRAGDQGSHVITATVTDGDGYTGISPGVGVVLTNPGPSATLTTPTDGVVRTAPPSCDTDSAAGEPLQATVLANPDTGTPISYVEYQLDGYAVAYGDSGTPGWDAVLAECYLTAGAHTLRVKVYDNDGLARTSVPVGFSFVSRPDPIAGLVATAGVTEVALSWTPPDFTGGLPLTAYRVQRVADDYATVLDQVDVPADVTSYTLSGLTGESALVQVQAVGPGGTSYPYGPVYVDLAPHPVTGLVATGGDRRLTVTFTPSTSPDVGTVQVFVGTGTAAPDVYGAPAAYLDPTASSTVIAGLAAATTYTVSVVVYDFAGGSSPPVSRTLLGTTLSTAAAPSTVAYGGATVVSGTLRRAGTATGLGARSLVLYQRRHGTTVWGRVGAVTTATNGVASSRRVPTVNTDYLWTYAGSGSEMASGGSVRVVGVAPKVVLALSATRVLVRHAVTVTGSVGPNHRGQRVYLQQKVGTGWRNVASAVLSSTSAVRFAYTPTVRGTFVFRLYKAADADHVASASAARSLGVV